MDDKLNNILKNWYEKLLVINNSEDLINQLKNIALENKSISRELCSKMFEAFYKVTSQNQYCFICLINAIMRGDKTKNGEESVYKVLLEPKIAEMFLKSFANSDENGKRQILKIFHIMCLYFSEKAINAISENLNISSLTKKLLTKDDRNNIEKFKSQHILISKDQPKPIVGKMDMEDKPIPLNYIDIPSEFIFGNSAVKLRSNYLEKMKYVSKAIWQDKSKGSAQFSSRNNNFNFILNHFYGG